MSYYEIKPKYDRFGRKINNDKHDKFWNIIKIIVIIVFVYIFCIKGIQIGDKIFWLRPL